MLNYNYKKLLFPIFIFLTFIVKGQNIDSLKNLINSIDDSEEKIELLIKLGNQSVIKEITNLENISNDLKIASSKIKSNKGFFYSFYFSSIYYGYIENEPVALLKLDSAELYRRSLKEDYYSGLLNIQKGILYQGLGKYDLSLKAYNTAINDFEDKKNIKKKISTIINVANLYRTTNQYVKAIENYQHALTKLENINDKFLIAKVYNNLGITYERIKENIKAKDSYEKALNYYNEINNTLGYASVLLNSANLYNDNIALQKLKKAKAIFEKHGLKEKTGKILNQIGIILKHQKKYDESIEAFQESIKYKKEKSTISSLINISDVYGSMADFDKALLYSDKALSLAQKYKDKRRLKQIYLLKSVINKDLKNFESAYNYNIKYHKLVDSLNGLKIKREILNLETKYQTQKKEAENQLLKKDKELLLATTQKQKITIWSTVIGLVFLGFLSFLLYRQNQLKQKTNKLLQEKNRKIELLHKELSHRVKNNLAFISGLMRMQGRRLDNEEAIKAVKEGESRIEAMSLLHRKLYLQENTQVNIGEYIEELCVNLQNTFPFLKKKPKIKLKVDEVFVDGETAMRIGLIVNELITNSFKYAFNDVDNPVIEITFNKKDDENYTLIYTDNGKGLPAEFDIGKTKSLGLKLIYTLTKQLKGNLEIKSKKGMSFVFDFKDKKIA